MTELITNSVCLSNGFMFSNISEISYEYLEGKSCLKKLRVILGRSDLIRPRQWKSNNLPNIFNHKFKK